LKDKKVSMDLVAPYSFVNKYKCLQDINKIEGLKNKKGDDLWTFNEIYWWRLLMDARTCFEQNHLI